jgi:hypothetical protein
MTNEEFQEAMRSGLGRAIMYVHDNNVQSFRDMILDACLHCYSVEPQSEGTRAGYMLELVSTLPDRQFYLDEVLRHLSADGDDWHAVQRFHFAAYMSFDGDEHARQVMYENFNPGPKMGEAIAIDFVRMDGLNGLCFVANKIGALLISRGDEVDEGWLWSQAVELCGEEEAKIALLEAGASNPQIEAYRVRALANRAATSSTAGESESIAALSYEQLKPKIHDLPAYKLRSWGKQASAEEIQRAADGLLTARAPEEQIRHLRMFSGRQFPLQPTRLLELLLSPREDLALAAAIALGQVEHPALREAAFRLIRDQSVGRRAAITILDRNFKPGDHEIALRWFENEPDRDVRHSMEIALRKFCEGHPEPESEVCILLSLYGRGPCSFCRECVVKRLINLDSLPELMRAECAYDANEDIHSLISSAS